MNAAATQAVGNCPTPAELAAFNSGQVSEALVETIGDHLRECTHCVALIDSLEETRGSVQFQLRDIDAKAVDGFDEVLAERGFKEFAALARNLKGGWSTVSGRGAHVPEDTAGERLRGGPDFIGGHAVLKPLGRGGFADVYLARHKDTGRLVAIKVPRPDKLISDAEIEQFLNEAQTVSKLSHPAIVSLVESGRDGSNCFVVVDYIDGCTLAERMKTSTFGRHERVSALATAAEALHHAHKSEFVHRDVKPSNILLDSSGNPYVSDFGLALHDDDQWQHQGEFAGTLPYMAPEQVRREAHRLDGRTDIWSVGVVLYEAMCHRAPFRGGNRQELMAEILFRDPKPPRQIDDTISEELERICLKCLSKKMVDRYSTALDLAEELRAAPVTSSPRERRTTLVTDPVMPRGVRSFGPDDMRFFLQLLPGPRDSQGIPDSVEFWKSRIESTGPESELPVGVVYGPSGCGKSSFVRAGLLPRLAEDILTIFVEATEGDTEERILAQLLSRCPELPHDSSLETAVAELRRANALPDGFTKVLIVVDQFEQWLHAGRHTGDSPLLRALRHCDGQHVQALLLVRSDFWMGITRFMRELEIPILEGSNSAPVDLFDRRHAVSVLTLFGRAYGALPRLPEPLADEQRTFVAEAVDQLAEDGNVICIRLALFAEMVRGKPWTSATLRELGGMAGVGVNYLDQMFCADTAPPLHRRHEESARAMLALLMPEPGTDIKGRRRTRSELLAQMKGEDRSESFTQILHILDNETRLVTVIDSEIEADGDDRKYYQLTHDYLVAPLREWLTRQQKETRRGRAQLRLEELAGFWNAKPEARRLPGLWEWGTLRLLTDKRDWTEQQSRMMSAAARVRGVTAAVSLLVVMLTVVAVQSYVSGRRADDEQKRSEVLVRSLLGAPAEAVPYEIRNLQELQQYALPILQERFETETDSSHRLRAAVALAEFGFRESDYLLTQIASAPRRECSNIARALYTDSAAAVGRLRELAAIADDNRQWQNEARLAIVEWNLGETSIARDMLRFRSDPTRRAVLIDTMSGWHGDVNRLFQTSLSVDDPAFRSGTCLGIGGIPPENLSADVSDKWKRLFLKWYRQCPESVIHSSAAWALRQWKVPLPDVALSEIESDAAQWSVNSLGMTILRVPAGRFVRQSPNPSDPPSGESPPEVGRDQTITLTNPYWLSDCEVAKWQFQQFIDDPDYPAEDKPVDWSGAKETRSPTMAHPVQQVSWIDAALFCNWLSHREHLAPCYERRGPVWRFHAKSNGYRLPFEAEWEHACRSGTTTLYASGNDDALLSNYAVFLANQTAICGSRMPNDWGLFDMHGNVYEWCHDWHGDYGREEHLRNPTGPARGTTRVLRSGAFDYGPDLSTATYRARNVQRYRSYTIGFRVARNDAAPDSDGSGKP